MRALGLALLGFTLIGCSDVLGADFDPNANANDASVNDSGADADDAAPVVPSGKVLWATGLRGNVQSAGAAGLLVDDGGNVYVAGIVAPPADFGCEGGPIEGHSDKRHAFLTKYAADGSCLWARLFDTGYGNRIAIGPDGNPWLAGYFSPELYVDDEVGTLVSAGYNDNFAIQVDAETGKPLVALRFGTANVVDEARTLLVHSSGDLLIAGGVKNPGGYLDAFLGRYTPSGEEVWYAKWGGPFEDLVSSMAWASPDKLVVGGTIRDDVTGDVVLEAQGQAMFAASFDVSGTRLWAKTVDGSGNDVAQTMAVGDGTTFLVGATTNPKKDVLLARKNVANGEPGIPTQYGLPTTNEVAYGIALTPTAEVRYLVGWFDGQTLLSDEAMLSAGDRDILIARVTNAGVSWTRRFGGGGTDVANAVAVAPDGNIVVLGTFTNESLELDEIEVPAGTGETFFLAKLAP
jgi:hypothetical protein